MTRLTGDRSYTPRTVVELDPDHPGFRDKIYRARRNEIAQIAANYRPGDPLPDIPYTKAEHEVWRTIWQALRPAHKKFACRDYLEHFDNLELPTDYIPQLHEVSQRTQELGGFKLEPVPGLVTPRQFLSVLSDRTFLATQYIRHHSVPLYTPEPDVVHEIIGHSVTFSSPAFAEMNRVVGDAVRRTRTERGVDFLANIFWFTLEFGVVMEDGEPKAFGAGLFSSAGELDQLKDAKLHPMDFDVMGKLPYDVTMYQPILFYAESFDDLQRKIHDFHEAWSDDYPDSLEP
jgi:phenylalanine-4-hydroxylase